MIYELFCDWVKARDLILPATEYHKTHTEDDIIVRLAAGEYKLWRTDECALITVFVQYPQFKALETRWAGGKLEALRALQSTIEKFASANGCKQIVCGGREGWSKVFPDYTKCGAVYFKEM